MSKATQSKSSPNLRGTLLLNSHTIHKATAVEITPGGNGTYAVTIRTVLDAAPEMWRDDFKGKVNIVYRNEHMPDVRLTGDFLDFGLQDEGGQCILSLFFRAVQEASPIVVPAKPQIQLAK